MALFKQSTAGSLTVGPILDSAGAEYASAVIGDLSISKNGGTLTALATAATLTYISNGYYTLALTTGNTDTTGRAFIACTKSTYQMPPVRATVLLASVFDAIVTNATTAAGGLGDIQRLAGQAITAAAGVTFPSSIASPTNITSATGVVLSGVTHTGAVIPTVSAVTGLTAANLDASISSRMATYTQPTGFLAATFPTGTVANTTNITAGTITTTTNLTNLPAITTDWLTGTGIAASGVTKIQAGLATPTNITAGTITTATNVTTVNGLAANVITAASMATDAGAEIADAVWDEVLSGHLTGGTTGAGLNAAGSAGDPWGTALPGAYTAGSAGYIMGTNMDATVSTRATQTSVNTIDDFLDTEVAAILAAVDTEVAAIKAKTDQLTFTVANQVDSNALSGGGSGLDAAGVRAAVGLASANLDTQLADLPTSSELTTALGTADDAVLAAITALSAATVKKNTAFNNFVFPMKLSSDHWSGAIGKTVTGTRVLDGGAETAVTGTITEVGSAKYQFDAAAADTNGDTVTWTFSNADCDDTIVTIKTST